MGKISDSPTYDGRPLVSRALDDDLYLLKIAGSSGELDKSIFLTGANYSDGKRIALDQEGSFLVNGTFENEIPVSSGGLTKRTTGKGNRSTFLGVFNTNANPAKDDGIIYLKNFSSPNDVFASLGMTLIDQGNQLDVYIPMVYDRDLSGLDGGLLGSNASGRLDIYIGQYQFPTIPTVISASRGAVTDPTTDPRYRYNVSGTNFFGFGDLSYSSHGR